MVSSNRIIERGGLYNDIILNRNIGISYEEAWELTPYIIFVGLGYMYVDGKNMETWPAN